MKADQKTFARVILCIATTVLCFLFFSPGRLLGGEAARSIASITIEDRQRLPDNTMVKLKSGRTVSLGTLRAEHRARLERFSRAAMLGKMAAGKYVVQPANTTQTGSARAEKTSPGQTVTAGKSGGVETEKTSPGQTVTVGKSGGVKEGVKPGVSNIGNIANLMRGSLVPFQMPTAQGTIPKDYADFCNAANPTVCIYLPASTTLTAFQGDPTTALSWAWDEDPLITDMSVCAYDGGSQYGTECLFYYPVIDVTNFKPTGALSTAGSCDPPSKYYLDPKGAIKAYYDYSSPTFTTGGTPITCAVQVWVAP